MRSAPVVVFLPFFKRLACITQCAEQCLVQTFISKFAVEAFDEAVLLGFSRRDIVQINACILNPFEDRHAGELGTVVRDNRLWHAAFSDDPIQLACNAVARQRSISHQYQVLAAEVVNNRKNAKPATIRQCIRHEI